MIPLARLTVTPIAIIIFTWIVLFARFWKVGMNGRTDNTCENSDYGSVEWINTFFTFFTRWAELSRKLRFDVEVQELNESGEYAPVEVQPHTDVGAGGIFQLRQGQQRRILVAITPVQNSGMLPVICDSILSVSVGCPGVRSKLQKPLDSYQEDDLNELRKKWIDALKRRSEVKIFLCNMSQNWV